MPLARQEANGHCDGAIDFGAAGWCTTHETTAGLAITQRHAGLRFLNAVQLTVFPDRLLGGLSSSTGCRGRPLGLAIAVQQAGDYHRPAGPRYPARGARGVSPCLGHGLAQNERGNPTQSEPRLVCGMLKGHPQRPQICDQLDRASAAILSTTARSFRRRSRRRTENREHTHRGWAHKSAGQATTGTAGTTCVPVSSAHVQQTRSRW